MNCELGDLAVIRDCSAGEEDSLGHFCTIVDAAMHPMTGAPGWCFDPPVMVNGDPRNCALDRNMRPIRHPGDDAVDEMLLRVGLPEAETA
jgi:hypothetical protein